MKSFLIAAFCTGLLLVSCNSSTPRTIELFNGENLEGWGFELAGDSIRPEEVFFVKDNLINIKGDPFGYMYTEKEYENYKLHAEWRWVGTPTNSGIFLHAQPLKEYWLDMPFPNAIECQLCAGKAGDFVFLGYSSMAEQEEGAVSKKKFNPSNEKPAGQWNTADILCQGDEITVWINGELQNKGTRSMHSKGSVCLQSEGGPIQFRHVTLTPLK